MYGVLCAQFEETKDSLKSVEENIRRLTGRDPDSFTATGNIKWKKEAGNFLEKQPNFQFRKRVASFKKNNPGENAPMKEEEEEEDEESPDDEVPSKKPSMQSAIVTTKKSIKSRRDTLAEQKGDKRILARNRRIFGMIVGTLQKFQSEESRRKDQAIKRAEIDKKVEEAAEKEKELMKKEKEELFMSRKDKQIQIRCLEKKLEIAEIYEVWEKNYKLLQNFIQTTAKPQVMFLPVKHSPKSLKSLQDTKEGISVLMAAKRAQLEKELADIEECYRRDSGNADYEEVGGKENFGPYEGQDSRDGVMDNEDINVPIKLEPGDEDRRNENPEITSNQDSLMDFAESSDNIDKVASGLTEVEQSLEETKPVDDHDEFEPIYD